MIEFETIFSPVFTLGSPTVAVLLLKKAGGPQKAKRKPSGAQKPKAVPYTPDCVWSLSLCLLASYQDVSLSDTELSAWIPQ